MLNLLSEKIFCPLQVLNFPFQGLNLIFKALYLVPEILFLSHNTHLLKVLSYHKHYALP